MFRPFPSNSGVLLASLALAACSSDPEASDREPVLTATLSGTVVDEELQVVVGMRVCVHSRPEIPCVKTDSLGKYDLGVPSNERLIVSYEKEEFVSKLWLLHTGEAGFYSVWFVQRRSWYEAQASVVQTPIDFERGMLSMQVAGTAGVGLSIEPMSGDGPYYAGEDLSLDPELYATGPSGVGAFVNLSPGSYRGAFALPGSTCVADVGGEPSPVVDVPVVAGHLTHVGARCE